MSSDASDFVRSEKKEMKCLFKELTVEITRGTSSVITDEEEASSDDGNEPFCYNHLGYTADYIPDFEFEEKDFIVMSNGNIISREAIICQPSNVEIPGGKCILKRGVVIRGDLAPVKINRYVVIEEETCLHPSSTIDIASNEGAAVKAKVKFIPLTIGRYTIIGSNCVVQSAIIGTGCIIGRNCVLSARTILKDHVKVLDDSVVPADMVIPPFALVAGNPAKIIGELSSSISTTAAIDATSIYKAHKLTRRHSPDLESKSKP